MSGHGIFRYLVPTVLAFVLGGLYFMAWRAPDGNEISRTLAELANRRYVTGWHPGVRVRLLLIAVACTCAGMVGVWLMLKAHGPW